ncbi:MAG: Amuc_1101 family PilM-like pilus complex protein [Verrucomicrobiales bacterium]
MADKKSHLTLNLGSQRLGLARFNASGKGTLTLTNYAITDLGGDPATDTARGPQLGAGLKGLAGQLKAAKESVRYAIAAQPVLSKFVKPPPLAPDKMDEVIGFEAQQAIPFPINEVCWHYQRVNKDGGLGDTEVVIAAVKKDLLEEVNGAVEAVPLTTEGVDIAPLALYNAFAFNYPDLAQPALLIDIGARTVNLLFIEPGGKFFFRTINNAGGANITSSIAKEFGVEFNEAEERKIAQGFVALSGYADHEDPELAALSKVIRNALTRTHGEIVRTTNLYRSQQGGSAPELVFLAGGGASLPYVKEFFEEKLNLPVEFFDALRNVQVGGKVSGESVATDRHVLGELVGLALRGSLACPMELDLVPPAVGLRRENARRKPFLFAAAASLLGLLGAGWLYNQHAASALNRRTSDLLETKAELSGWDSKIAAADAQAKKEQARAEYLQTAVLDRTYWLEMFNELNSIRKNDLIWITQFEPTASEKSVTPALQTTGEVKTSTFDEPLLPPVTAAKGAKPAARGASAPAAEAEIDGVHIFGLYRNHENPQGNQVVTEFFEDLKKNSKFFQFDDKIELAQYIKTDSPDENYWASTFEMRLPLKRRIRIPADIKSN